MPKYTWDTTEAENKQIAKHLLLLYVSFFRCFFFPKDTLSCRDHRKLLYTRIWSHPLLARGLSITAVGRLWDLNSLPLSLSYIHLLPPLLLDPLKNHSHATSVVTLKHFTLSHFHYLPQTSSSFSLKSVLLGFSCLDLMGATTSLTPLDFPWMIRSRPPPVFISSSYGFCLLRFGCCCPFLSLQLRKHVFTVCVPVGPCQASAHWCFSELSLQPESIQLSVSTSKADKTKTAELRQQRKLDMSLSVGSLYKTLTWLCVFVFHSPCMYVFVCVGETMYEWGSEHIKADMMHVCDRHTQKA